MIVTERLKLRPWRESDRLPFRMLCADKRVMEHLGGPRSAADADAAMERMIKSEKERGHCFWAVERKSDFSFIGFCGLLVCEKPGTPVDGEIEIGWRSGTIAGARASPRKPPTRASTGASPISMWSASSRSPCRKTRAAGG